ncbi:hypothetical protein DB88DRAFT_499959 [Papiliotrema laurentii]|uniref:Uncharacterized protein n=1 Tax=Papiliotrema laurentii TaxID=5418 RepID=A0AAD9FLX0_PAPLA|nr:hypothetical protein DB88DRAFT_499959 [Papiliotrema laurentii]
MDADPWADAPSSSRPATPADDPSPAKPSVSSPLAETSRRSPTPSPPRSPIADEASSAPSPVSSPKAGAVEERAEDVDLPPSDPVYVAEPLDMEPGASQQQDEGGDDFDDFDDFGEQPEAGPSGVQSVDAALADAEFDDFGDFDDGAFEEAGPESGVFAGAVQAEPEPERWHALRLNPMPSSAELVDQLVELLRPIRVEDDGVLTDEPPRQTGGLSQVMITESSREAYAQLTTPPMLQTLDWTRSRVRRDHLISMGVPVNLDEVDSHRLSALPPLRITTNFPRPRSQAQQRSSTDSYRSSALDKGKDRELPGGTGSQSVPVSAVANGHRGDERRQREKYGLGSKPLLDTTVAEDLCGIDEDQLSLLSVERLRTMQQELVETSAAASALLAWELQYKDAQVQDSATYNGMISELIANAAKAKSAQAVGSGGVFKRSSIRRPTSGSPGISPRIGSPAMR